MNDTFSRRALVTTGFGAAFAAAFPGPVTAAELTALEQANVRVVNDFCAAFAGHDLARIMSFLTEGGAYRMTETTELAQGREAVSTRIKSFLDRVGRFEVLETFAKGPMVFNERRDYFTGGQLRSWHGVGVFFLKDGKIVEWYDYTIAIDRA